MVLWCRGVVVVQRAGTTAGGLPDTLRVRTAGPVAVLTLARAAKRNALNDSTVLGIERFFRTLDPAVRVVVIDADGDQFFGGQPAELAALVPGAVRQRFTQAEGARSHCHPRASPPGSKLQVAACSARAAKLPKGP